MTHLFLDTNVVIDFLVDRKPFSIQAAKLFDHAEKGRIKIYISTVSYNNIYYIVKKLSSHKQTISILKDLEKITETVGTTKKIMQNALNSEFKDYEDAIQYYCATSHKKIEAIITRDVADFKNADMTILTLDEALSIIESVLR
jgi:predicted nucleic acid-binding protein